MARNIRSTCLLVALVGSGLTPPAMAWTSSGSGPSGPGYRSGYPEPPPGVGSSGPDFSSPTARTNGYAGRQPPRDGPAATPQVPSPNAGSPLPAAPGYGPPVAPPRGYPDSGRRGFGVQDFGRPFGFRISRTTSEDAYILTIALDGMEPDTVQVRAQGPWLLLSRTHSARKAQKDRFDDGRGHRRSFSYSSGTTRRRLSVPPDAILSAMSRKDDKDRIRIRIPRRGHQGAGKDSP